MSYSHKNNDNIIKKRNEKHETFTSPIIDIHSIK